MRGVVVLTGPGAHLLAFGAWRPGEQFSEVSALVAGARRIRHSRVRNAADLGGEFVFPTVLHDVLARRQPRIPDHPDSLAARHEIARILAVRGNISEALTEFQDVLGTKIRILGPDHPSTVLTVHEIESLAAN
jgi:hypothetical protein